MASPTIMTDRAITPPALAKRYGCRLAKVHAWIASGELQAINLGDGSQRPRWRITPHAIEVFEARRASRPCPDVGVQRRGKPEGVTEYFV